MTSEDIDEWLDSWIEMHHAHWGSPEKAAGLCIAAAAEAGISERDLNAASGGDLALYLQEEGEAIAEASGAAPDGF
ncbi:hypothetical protein ACFFGF_05645 [Asaia lannensis]|uniref:Uncharacterized protein n=1 Tax=Asaia lannensis NBRC 102526 TaxID=1307926 RepID=A0ABT1CGH2_9PROT|nr:hypothetical protein [Asaia lannensis]MCO6159965.1 hypothetical protein [Asaia lannensis NBRC 102526]GBQ95723.1 hypothetical protein AA102526_0518 [Asaia lannensis NBRC 102526]